MHDGPDPAIDPQRNRLDGESSPYLRQHRANPVHWWPWGVAALEAARRADKPILLSIGYAACHWCHVMAHESFEDRRTAEAMNAGFVNIKVDREERPDLDHLYMTALQAMGQRGGWPLTMFLQPDGTPFWGGTYFPPEPRYGQPAFREVLQAIGLAWRERADVVIENGARLRDMLMAASRPEPGDWPHSARRDEIVQRWLARLDRRHGGLAGAPKFPNLPLFRCLDLRAVARDELGAEAARAVADLLGAMIDGGIHDQIGGGFARYATDIRWLVPHFEKMLCDNGQILDLLACAHVRTARLANLNRADMNDGHLDAAEAVVSWLMYGMRTQGALAASLDADSEGEEGRFYVWQAGEVAELLRPLGPQAAAQWQRAYGVTEAGNWEGRSILHRAGPLDRQTAQAGARLLLKARATRTPPARDDKVLADWNAMTVSGLCRAARAFNRPAWGEFAQDVFLSMSAMLEQVDGRLAHAACAGRVSAAGLLDDQAAGALAALALYETLGAERYIDRAIALCEIAERWFADPDGSYFLTASDATDLPGNEGGRMRPRILHDGAVPSGVAMLAEAQARLFHLTGGERWRAAATRTIRGACGGGDLQVAQQPALLHAAMLLETARVVVVDGTDQASWREALGAISTAEIIVVPHIPAAVLPAGHPAHGRQADPGETRAWVCSVGRCSLPIETLADLVQTLHVMA